MASSAQVKAERRQVSRAQGMATVVTGLIGQARGGGVHKAKERRMGLLRERGRCGDCCHGSFWLARMPSSGHHDSVWAAWDVLIAPLDHQRVFSLVLEQVGDTVKPAAHMFD